jgi:ferric-dicitrate binding protein FerR (iron transport regulator)
VDAATRTHSHFSAAPWALHKSPRHRETMTAVVPSPPQAAEATFDSPRARQRRHALGAISVLAGGCALVLLAEPQSGPGWVHWGASLMTLAAACVALAAGQLSWEHTVATARADDLVARP